MSETQIPSNPSMARVHQVIALEPKQYELWKYYEDRADRLGERLWTIGIWFMAVLAATLSLPFAAGFIRPTDSFIPAEVVSRIPTAILAMFGMLFCIYAYSALRDIREHIESNWRKAGYVLESTWKADWGGRKSDGWGVLLAVGAMAFIAFAAMFIASVYEL